MAGHIVVVGSLNMDLVVRAPRLPEPGETILGSDFHNFPGGKGANQAVAAARLGGKVNMIGRVGKDSFGDSLFEEVNSEGIETKYILRDPKEATGVALITVDETGQNTIVVSSGANSRLTPIDVANAEEAFADAAVLLLQLESPLSAVARAIELAKHHGVKVVLNPAPAQMLQTKLLTQVDYLIPNQTELALLAGVEGTDTAVSCLRGLGVTRLIVTLGDQGVLVIEKNKEIQLQGYAVEVVDTTAAGDAFVGAFAVALTEGKSALEAAEFGNAAGALTVMRSGAQPSLPTRAELDQFLEQANQRRQKKRNL
jgi:ribokinase